MYKKDKPNISKARDRGSLEFKSKLAAHEGSIMSIATKNVITIPPTMSIKGAAETMTKYRFRRIPVADPGTGRLLGIIGSTDIIDFLGGKEKALLIQKKHNGNFLAAINDSVRVIMVTDVLTLYTSAKIKDALNMILKSGVGGIIIVSEDRRVEGIVTERDFVFLLSDKFTGKKVGDYMTKKVITATPKTTLGEATKIMTENSFRRLPIVEGDNLAGLLTTRMVIDFVGRNHVFAKIVENKLEEILEISVKEIMKTRIPTLPKDADIGEAAKVIEETGVGTVCIVEDSKLAGILTERDIVKALA